MDPARDADNSENTAKDMMAVGENSVKVVKHVASLPEDDITPDKESDEQKSKKDSNKQITEGDFTVPGENKNNKAEEEKKAEEEEDLKDNGMEEELKDSGTTEELKDSAKREEPADEDTTEELKENTTNDELTGSESKEDPANKGTEEEENMSEVLPAAEDDAGEEPAILDNKSGDEPSGLEAESQECKPEVHTEAPECKANDHAEAKESKPEEDHAGAKKSKPEDHTEAPECKPKDHTEAPESMAEDEPRVPEGKIDEEPEAPECMVEDEEEKEQGSLLESVVEDKPETQVVQVSTAEDESGTQKGEPKEESAQEEPVQDEVTEDKSEVKGTFAEPAEDKAEEGCLSESKSDDEPAADRSEQEGTLGQSAEDKTASETDEERAAEKSNGESTDDEMTEDESYEGNIENASSHGKTEDEDLDFIDLTVQATCEDDYQDNESASRKANIPLHRLMIDYKERKPTWEKESRVEGSRKSVRPKKAPESFVAGPAVIFKKKTLKQKKNGSKKIKEAQKRFSQALIRTKKPAVPNTGVAKSPTEKSLEIEASLQEADSWQEDLEKCRRAKPFFPMKAGVPSSASSTPRSRPLSNPGPTRPIIAPSNVLVSTSTRKGTDLPKLVRPASKGTPKPALRNTDQERALAVACIGKKFPEQLMLLMSSNVARGRMWWTPDGAGRAFAFDLSYFRDDVMKSFFPPNIYKRITVTLNRWGFRRVFQELPEGFMAYQHPLFERFSPNTAKQIELLDRKKKPHIGLPTGHSPQFTSNSMMHVGREQAIAGKRKRAPDEAKLPPSVLIASLRMGENARAMDLPSDLPPSVRIAALRRDPPQKKVETFMQQNSSATAQGRSQGQEPKPYSPVSAASHPREVFAVDHVVSSGRYPGEKRKIDCLGQNLVSARYQQRGQEPPSSQPHHTGETRKTEKRLAAPTISQYDIVAHLRNQCKGQYLRSPSMTTSNSGLVSKDTTGLAQRLARDVEAEKRLQIMVAERKINEAAAEATRAVHQIAGPSSMRRLSGVGDRTEERAAKRQKAIQEEMARAHEEMALAQHQAQTHNQRRIVDRIVAEDEEAARRRRLASALYGSGKPKAADPPPKAAPKQPTATTATTTGNAMDPSAAYTSRAGLGLQQNPALSNAQLEALAFFQQQQQRTQALLNGYLVGGGPPARASSALPADATLEQLLLMQRFSRR